MKYLDLLVDEYKDSIPNQLNSYSLNTKYVLSV